MSTDGLAVRSPNPIHVLMIGLHQSWLAKRGHAKKGRRPRTTRPWRGFMCAVGRRESSQSWGTVRVEQLASVLDVCCSSPNATTNWGCFYLDDLKRDAVSLKRKRRLPLCDSYDSHDSHASPGSRLLYLALHDGYRGCGLVAAHSTRTTGLQMESCQHDRLVR